MAGTGVYSAFPQPSSIAHCWRPNLSHGHLHQPHTLLYNWVSIKHTFSSTDCQQATQSHAGHQAEQANHATAEDAER